MKEIAFTVDPESKTYADYMKAKAEKQKFHDLAMAFLKKHDLFDEAGSYGQTDRLCLDLSEETRGRFADQICKARDCQGMTVFKQRSPLQKEWKTDVVSQVDMKSIDAWRFWAFPFVLSGSYTMWDADGTVYGYLEAKYGELEDVPAPWMHPIKKSEYYRVVEELEARNGTH